MKARSLLALALCALLVACGTSEDPEPDAGTSSVADAGSESTPDGGATTTDGGATSADGGQTNEPDAGQPTEPDAGGPSTRCTAPGAPCVPGESSDDFVCALAPSGTSGSCSHRCDPYGTCDAPDVCRVQGTGANVEFFCGPAGNAAVGTNCQSSDQCAAGAACVAGTCARVCDPAATGGCAGSITLCNNPDVSLGTPSACQTNTGFAQTFKSRFEVRAEDGSLVAQSDVVETGLGLNPQFVLYDGPTGGRSYVHTDDRRSPVSHTVVNLTAFDPRPVPVNRGIAYGPSEPRRRTLPHLGVPARLHVAGKVADLELPAEGAAGLHFDAFITETGLTVQSAPWPAIAAMYNGSTAVRLIGHGLNEVTDLWVMPCANASACDSMRENHTPVATYDPATTTWIASPWYLHQIRGPVGYFLRTRNSNNIRIVYLDQDLNGGRMVSIWFYDFPNPIQSIDTLGATGTSGVSVWDLTPGQRQNRQQTVELREGFSVAPGEAFAIPPLTPVGAATHFFFLGAEDDSVPVPAAGNSFLKIITDDAAGVASLTPVFQVGEVHVVGTGSYAAGTYDWTLTSLGEVCDDTGGFGICRAP